MSRAVISELTDISGSLAKTTGIIRQILAFGLMLIQPTQKQNPIHGRWHRAGLPSTFKLRKNVSARKNGVSARFFNFKWKYYEVGVRKKLDKNINYFDFF